jgi:hypothetical protein
MLCLSLYRDEKYISSKATMIYSNLIKENNYEAANMRMEIILKIFRK